MKDLYFNLATLEEVTNESCSLAFDLDSDFNNSKIVEVESNPIQKTDEYGNPLYYENIYRTEIKEVVAGKEETTTVTDEPIMEVVQKTNINGEPLFYEVLVEEDDMFETTKPISEQGEINIPVYVEVQRTTLKGLPLYLKDRIIKEEVEVLDRKEETIEVMEEPVMIPTFETRLVTLKENPQFYTVEEVKSLYETYLTEKYGKITRLLTDVNEESTLANLGVNLVNLPPKGHVTFNRISLDESINVVEVETLPHLKYYVNNKLLNDSKVVLSNPVKNITVKISNTLNHTVDIHTTKIYCSFIEDVE